MKAIVIGAGAVGFDVAKLLSMANNDYSDEMKMSIDSIETKNEKLIHKTKNKVSRLQLELRGEVTKLEMLEQIQRETKHLSKLINN